MNAPLYLPRYSSSHSVVARSRWFVGSSSSSRSGRFSKVLPSAIRLCHPPEKWDTSLVLSFGVKPRPWSTVPTSRSMV